MEQTKTIPSITIDSWPNLAIPVDEIKNTLSYLAYRTSKPVTFRCYSENEGYSYNSISVRVVVANSGENLSSIGLVKLGEKEYELFKTPFMVDIGKDVPEKNKIVDDNLLTIAFVDYNRIIIPFELTVTDNETSSALLSHIIERSIDLLDFKMNGKLLEQRRKLAQHFCESFAKNVQTRVVARERELRDNEHESEKAYYTILNCEQQKPVIQKELEFLKKLGKIDEPRLFRTQAQSLIELQASGEYTSIIANNDGSFTATTAPIIIEYDGLQFPLGRYTIHLDLSGDCRIKALDPHPEAEYPHPHVASDGLPCLGNIRADIPKMLGTMRIAEALQTLYAFLSTYNPDSPYEKISHFDPSGEYSDEDENPCDDCDERCSPYCIFECSNNDGQYECSDCSSYRTDYCYTQCNHNQDFSQFSPCDDDCDDKGNKHCYLECEYNDQWELQNSCSCCNLKRCNKKCKYFTKLQELKETAGNENIK